MQQNLNLALLSLEQSEDSIESNLRYLFRGLEMLTTQPNMVFTPETSLSGNQEITIYSKYLKEVASMAKENNVWITTGAYIVKEQKKLNALLTFDNNGDLVNTYYKVNPWITEKDVIAGEYSNLNPIQTPYGKIGVINCWDIVFPKTVKELSAKGARLIVDCAYWYPNKREDKLKEEFEKIFSLVRVRALENQVFMGFVDAANQENSKFSLISNSYGHIINSSKNGILEVMIDLSKVEKSREFYRINPEL